MEIGLSLGSNMGDRLANLLECRRRLAAVPFARITAQSGVYETSPQDVPARFAEMNFLNAALVIECSAALRVFAAQCARIEREMGRPKNKTRNAPRIIDIDVIYAGDTVLAGKRLVVPHPRWSEREFVLRPLADVRPDLLIPGARASVARLLSDMKGENGVEVFRRNW